MDDFVINVEIAGRPYPIRLDRGDSREESLFRQAAKRVQQNVLQYRQYFAKSVEERDLLAMIAIQLAYEATVLEEKNDTKPFIQKVQKLTGIMEEYLQAN
ncbi:MAG: cell division protein ZapA [Tannerella sp.]|jgi:cell division protein ZapA|nr:cell division protein ZapA [Tannerella sp.]